jgi:hypothetical protein
VRLSSERLLAGAGLAALFVGIAIAVIVGARSGGDDARATRETPRTTQRPAAPAPPPPAAPKPIRVRLQGVSGFDPEGDGRENDDAAAAATDGDPATFWPSETYSSFFKDGVGLLLDAGKRVRLTRLVVRTDTPEIAASVRVGIAPEGPFTPVSPTKRLGASTTFALRSRPARYVVVWVEDIPDGSAAHLNEVTGQATGQSRR